jgi:hypothetical protein
MLLLCTVRSIHRTHGSLRAQIQRRPPNSLEEGTEGLAKHDKARGPNGINGQGGQQGVKPPSPPPSAFNKPRVPFPADVGKWGVNAEPERQGRPVASLFDAATATATAAKTTPQPPNPLGKGSLWGAMDQPNKVRWKPRHRHL